MLGPFSARHWLLSKAFDSLVVTTFDKFCIITFIKAFDSLVVTTFRARRALHTFLLQFLLRFYFFDVFILSTTFHYDAVQSQKPIWVTWHWLYWWHYDVFCDVFITMRHFSTRNISITYGGISLQCNISVTRCCGHLLTLWDVSDIWHNVSLSSGRWHVTTSQKNHKIAFNSTTALAEEKLSTHKDLVEF